MTTWKNLLLEGKMESQTTELSRAIVEWVKKLRTDPDSRSLDMIKDDEWINISFSPDKILDTPLEYLHEVDLFIIAQVMGDKPDPPPGAIHATYFREPEPEFSSMEVYLYFPPEPSLVHLGHMVPRLKETLRHELEHSEQSEETLMAIGGVPEFDDFDSVKRTYLSDGEVAAWVSGLYKRAKMQKIPLSEIIDESVELLRIRVLDAHEEMGLEIMGLELSRFIEQLKDRWTQYARQRFPRAQ
jgi:hypothetical protein